MSDALRVLAHAKINLFLRILARESSGFHQIETAFALLELADELVVRRTDSGVTLEVEGPDLVSVRFWERGVGVTLASGAGSTAACGH